MPKKFPIKVKWLAAFIVITACVEEIQFDVAPAEFQTVIEGTITDTPGPYFVRISSGISLEVDSVFRAPVSSATVMLFDDEGNSESMTEISPGVYATAGLIRGQTGHHYFIRVVTPDGKVFESVPDRMNPVGEIENIRYEYEKRTTLEPFGEVPADVFSIYVDSQAGSSEENYVRWRFTGTHEVITWPWLHYTDNPPYTPYRNPFPCSGYILTLGPEGSGGILLQVGECTCCTCWASQYESLPQLSDTQLVSDNQFQNIKVGEVPINNATFHTKYMVEVEQMSLSRQAFDFFKLVREQKENASSLFQPPSGEIRGNFLSLNGTEPVAGIFWATTIRKKTIFIDRKDVPYPVVPIDYITLPCNEFYPHASAKKPDAWKD